MSDTENIGRPQGEFRVLIVDDIEDMVFVMTGLFEQAGAKVESSTRPDKAFEIAEARIKLGEPHDMIVIDIRMPRKSGHELAKDLRAAGYEGPIVAFTSVATGGGRKLGGEVGITTYLSKETLSKGLIMALIEQYRQ